MTLLFITHAGAGSSFAGEAKRLAPELDVRQWPECGNPDEIEFVAAHYLDGVDLARFKNLKFVASLYAGVDHLVREPVVQKGVPLVRAADPKGDALMNETALLHVLRHHRHLHEYAVAQAAREWKPRRPVLPAGRRKVGVAGLGQIGLGMAQSLKAFGFDVAGWTRTQRKADGIEVYCGQEGFGAFLARTEILVAMLPATRETENILDAKAFAKMPKGACLINLARGDILRDADLLAALDSGQLAGATLDAFRVEPLPKDDRLWGHPRITIIPHVSRAPAPREIVPQVLENVRRSKAGQPLAWPVNLEAGY